MANDDGGPITKNKDEEAEANYFAMHLLVPTEMLAREDLTKFDLTDDDSLKNLAKKYGVSLTVMILRVQEFLSRKAKP